MCKCLKKKNTIESGREMGGMMTKEKALCRHKAQSVRAAEAQLQIAVLSSCSGQKWNDNDSDSLEEFGSATVYKLSDAHSEEASTGQST